VNIKTVIEHQWFKPALGAGLTVCCGLALWIIPLGERWVDASYDYLFRFGARPVTNQVVLILMDNKAHTELGQVRGKPWARAVHAKLLNQLAADECPLVVIDSFFGEFGDPNEDQALAQAMRRLKSVVLLAKQEDVAHPGVLAAQPRVPAEPFLSASRTNWGVAWLDPDLDSTVRRHWPFPAPAVQYQSLPWASASQAGARLSDFPQERWLRYYGPEGSWTSLSYHLALKAAPNYFRHRIVFIGNKPTSPVWDREPDKFRTPYTRWTRNTVGGVEIMATAFLNLVNGEWLRRPAEWVECVLLVLTGILLGSGLCRARRLPAFGLAALAALAFTLGAVSLSYVTNFWLPWLVVVGGQVPCALAWSLLAPQRGPEPEAITREDLTPKATSQTPDQAATTSATMDLPEAPDYELFDPPFAEGAYGKVWLARNAVGQWQALKAVYLAKFGSQTHPYEREFRGIRKYKPISDKHPGLLRVDFVSMQKPSGYFYYVMELGDGLEPGWKENPSKYMPGDLAKIRARAEDRRLPVRECLRIGIGLAEALEFLHSQGLTHRDIKPQNIIFVNRQPKLADVGLVDEVWPPEKERTWVGTPGYMPPPPEPPGTIQADIYGLGMVLFVVLTGRNPAFYPEIATTLGGEANLAEAGRLTAVILKACESDLSRRYATAGEMLAALRAAGQAIEA
jgi:CHASE2 domain-containing sensor protein